MKQLRVLFLVKVLCATGIVSNAQKGINFVKTGNFNVALNLAKQQNKLLFMEVYAPDCHICNSFKGTFAQPQVGALYNTKFVNFQLDIRKQENYQLLQKMKLNINATPTFIFIDPKTSKIIQAKIFGEKENSIINVNSIAQKAINPIDNYSTFAGRLKSGDKNPQFLLNYAEVARLLGDTLANIKAMNEYIKLLPQSQYTSQNTFNIIQKDLMNNDNPLFDYFISHISSYEKFYEPGLVRMTYENIFQITLVSSFAQKLDQKGIQKIKDQMIKAGIEKNSIPRRTWMLEASILFKQKKNTQAIQVINQLIQVLPSAPGPKEYQFLCNFVKARTKDKKSLQYAKKQWCKFGLE
ncbi:thioredoxin family protein [Aquirufa sp. ROCK-SH2]